MTKTERVFWRQWNLRAAFARVFGQQDTRDDAGEIRPDTARVLDDLNTFCHATTSCIVHDKEGRIDPIATAREEGKREVLLRIEQWLALTDAELFKLRRILNPDDEDLNDDDR